MYKRQEKAFPAQIISLLRGFLLILPLAFGLAYLAGITGVWLAFPVTEGLTAMGGVLPVSYTHLDVYKRQGYNRFRETEQRGFGAEDTRYCSGCTVYLQHSVGDVKVRSCPVPKKALIRECCYYTYPQRG